MEMEKKEEVRVLERACACVLQRQKERERECVCVCVRVMDGESVCVDACVRECVVCLCC